MSELKTPDEVLNSIYQTVDQRIGWTSHAEDAINIAAPLIVAAELRRMAAQWEDEYPFERAVRLHERANELDPQGVTQ